MSGPCPLRVVLFTNVLAPYRLPVFRALARMDGIRLTVWLCAEMEVSRHWALDGNMEPFGLEVLKGWTTSRLNRVTGHYAIRHFRPGVVGKLIRERPDVLVLGDASFLRYLAAWVARKAKVPYVLWSEEVPSGASRWRWARWLFRWAVRGASAWAAGSTTTRDYLVSIGADPTQTVLATNTVNSSALKEASEQMALRREALRAGFGVGKGEVALLFVGRLIPFKRPGLAMEILAVCLRRGIRAQLWVAGDGLLLEPLRDLAEACGIESGIRWLGHLDPAGLYERYAAADVLLACSTLEAWGFVVQEALHFGLPVVASDTVAAARDLIRHDAAIVPHNSPPDRFANAVETVLGARWEAGKEWLLADWCPEDQANCFLEAIRLAAGREDD